MSTKVEGFIEFVCCCLPQVLYVLGWAVRRRKRWCIWPPRMQVPYETKYNITVCFLFFFHYVHQPNHWFLIRIWSSRAADIWRGCQGPALQEEDTGSDWCTGGRPSQSEKQAAGVGSPAVWHHHPLWVQPFIITLNHIQWYKIHLSFSTLCCICSSLLQHLLHTV